MSLKIVEAQSVSERIESRIRAAEKLKKGWANIEAVRKRPEGSYLLTERFFGANVVTSAGDVYYAQMGAGGGTVTNDFDGANGRHEMRTQTGAAAEGNTYGDFTWITTTRKALTGGYPTANDTDPDNTASNKAQKVTWQYSYTTGDFNQTGLFGGCIHAAGTNPLAGTALLSSYTFAAAFDKTSSDTLKVIINHDFEGA